MSKSRDSRYDIEADWVLNLICNYRCGYCISSAPRDPPLVGKLSPSKVLDFFNSTGKTWMLHLSGGEPFMYPEFVALCSALCTSHYISINSNLTTRHVAEFSKTIPPDRVTYIHCGVHPEQRELRRAWKPLIRRLEMLVDAGFAVFASCVMTSESFDAFESASEMLAKVGVPLIPKAMRGSYQERNYPASYSDIERRRFIEFSEEAERRVRDNIHQPLRNDPTVNPLMDRYLLHGIPDFRGVLCSAGRDFVTIAPDGNIYVCGNTGRRIGNLFSGTLKLADVPQPCSSEWCHYTCVRFSEVDVAAAAGLPFVPLTKSLGERIAGLVEYAHHGIENRLIQLTLR